MVDWATVDEYRPGDEDGLQIGMGFAFVLVACLLILFGIPRAADWLKTHVSLDWLDWLRHL